MLNSGALLLCALQKVYSIIACIENINWYKLTYISGIVIDKKSSWQIQTGKLLASRPHSTQLPVKTKELGKIGVYKEGRVGGEPQDKPLGTLGWGSSENKNVSASGHSCSVLIEKIISQHFVKLPLGPPCNDICTRSEEIP